MKIMSNEIQIIEQREVLQKDFKIYGTKENPLFLAKDVSEWIEHSNARVMLQNIDDDEKVVKNVYTLGGNQEAWFLTEDGLYEVLMQSRKPIAKQFKKEVKKILKQIRLTGAFVPGQSMEDIMIYSLNEMKNVKSQLNQVNNNALRASKTSEDVKKSFDELPLFAVDSKELTKNVNRRVVTLLGGKGNEAYRQLSKISENTFLLNCL